MEKKEVFRDGYELAEQVFKRIGQNPDHRISIKDAVKVISWWGFSDGRPSGQIGFVRMCATNRITEAIEKALINRDYRGFDKLVEIIEAQKKEESNEKSN